MGSVSRSGSGANKRTSGVAFFPPQVVPRVLMSPPLSSHEPLSRLPPPRLSPQGSAVGAGAVGSLVVAQSFGRNIDVFRLRSEEVSE